MKVFLAVAFFVPTFSFAEALYCRSHSYGDTTYDVTVDTEKFKATVIGSDRWYHEDFFKAVVKDVRIHSVNDLIHVEGKNFLGGLYYVCVRFIACMNSPEAELLYSRTHCVRSQ